MADRFNVCDQPVSTSVLASVRSTSAFTMTTAATEEDVPTMSATFTFDGRPIRIRTTPMLTNQDQATVKLITVKLCRSSDNAAQATAARNSTASATEVQSMTADTGFFTAWPSDSVALVKGTQYTVKLRLLAGSSSKATINGLSQPYCLEVLAAG